MRQYYDHKDNATEKLAGKKTEVIVPSPRKLAWLMIRRSDELEAEEKRFVELLLHDANLAELRQLAHGFMHLVHNGLSEKWSSWLERSCESAVKEMRNFAIGLKQDSAAVYEAIRQSWSNGATEAKYTDLNSSSGRCTAGPALTCYDCVLCCWNGGSLHF